MLSYRSSQYDGEPPKPTLFVSTAVKIEHGNPVADGRAGAVMQKPLAIQKYFGPTDLPTYRHTDVPTYRHGEVELRVRD